MTLSGNSQPNASQPNASQLRAAIDRGEAGDKTPFADPAAVPLGADDEAAGTTPTGGQVEASLKAEAGRPDEPEANASAAAPTNVSVGPAPASKGDLPGYAPWLAVAVVVAVALGVLLGMRIFGL